MRSSNSKNHDPIKQLFNEVGVMLGARNPEIEELRLDEQETTKVKEESLRQFSHASKCVWKMDREA